MVFEKLLSIIVAFSARSAIIFVSLLLTWALPQFIGVEGLGLFFFGYSLTLFVSTLARFGLSIGLVKWGAHLLVVSTQRDCNRMFINASINCLFIACLVSLAIFLYVDVIEKGTIGDSFTNVDLLPFFLAVPANALLYILGAYVKVVDKPNVAPLVESALPNFLALIFGILFGLIAGEWTAAQFCWGFTASSYLVLVVALALLFLKAGRSLFADFGSMLAPISRKAIWTQGLRDYAIIDFINFFLQYGVILIIGIMLNDYEVGLFTVALRIASLLSFILVVFNSITIASYSKLFSQSDYEGLKSLANRTSLFSVIAAAPVVSAIYFFPIPLLSLFGEAFIVAKEILLILTLGQAFNVLTGTVGPLLNMSGAQRVMRNLTVVSFLFSIASLWYLSMNCGTVGAAVAVALSVVLKNALAYYYTKQKLGFFVRPSLGG